MSRTVRASGVNYVNGFEEVSAQDILSFSWQICKGMTYLANMKLVHRDLGNKITFIHFHVHHSYLFSGSKCFGG